MAKVLDIPEPVEIVFKAREKGQEDKAEEVEFPKWIGYVCGGYEPFRKGPEQGRTYNRIMNTVEKLEDGAKNIVFEDADFKILKLAAKDAVFGSPDVNRSYVPFYDALDNAQDIDTPQKT